MLLLLGVAVLVLLLGCRRGGRLGVLLVLLLRRWGTGRLRVLLLVLLGLLLLAIRVAGGIVGCRCRYLVGLLLLLRVDLRGVGGVLVGVLLVDGGLLGRVLLVQHGLGLLGVHLDLAVVAGAGLLLGLEVQADLVGEVGERGDEEEPARERNMSATMSNRATWMTE